MSHATSKMMKSPFTGMDPHIEGLLAAGRVSQPLDRLGQREPRGNRPAARRPAHAPMLDPWPDSAYTLLIARAGSHLCRVWRRPLSPCVARYSRPSGEAGL